MDNEPQTTEVQTTETAAPTAIVGPDGKFSEGWLDRQSDDIKGADILKRAQDFPGLLQTVLHQEKTIGSYQRSAGLDKVAVPTEASGKEEWEAYFKAGGRPDTPQEYDVSRPENFPEEMYSEERASKWLNILHEEGASKKLVARLWAEHHNDLLSAVEAGATATENSAEEIKAKVLEEWGNAYEANVHIGNVGAAKAIEGQPDEFKERLLGKINGDPDLVKFSYLLGKQFVESDGAPHIKVTQSTPVELDQKIAALRANPAYMQNTHPEHQSIQDQITSLYKQKSGIKVQ